MKVPNIGSAYMTLDGQSVRRVLMKKTGNHLYYVVESSHDRITVYAVWGAPKGQGPKL